MRMTASQWAEWADKRQEQATTVSAMFRRQANQVRQMLDERNCSCDPLIELPTGDMGGPGSGAPSVTHSLLCSQG